MAEQSISPSWFKLFPIVVFALALGSCESTKDPVYESFKSNAASNGVDLNQYSGYTVEYVSQRVNFFCQLMDSGEITKLSIQLNFGDTPGGLFSKPDSGGFLQKVIWRSGTPIVCPQNNKYLQ